MDDLKKDIRKVLIVDDDEVIRNLLFGVFNSASEGYLTQTASDGFEAGQMLERFRPDMLVLDLFMPTIDGFRICREIKQNYPEIKIVVITGHHSADVEEKILQSGADEYLIKPFDIVDFLETVEELLVCKE